jgi:acetyl esterase/lipase
MFIRLLKLFSIFTSLFALVGCSKAAILNSIVPNDGYTVSKDIPYGRDPKQTLDIYMPDTGSNGSVLVFFHGGSWQGGDKSLYKFVGQAFTSKGYTVVVPNYRVYPQVYFPAFVEDSAASIAWVHKHIGEYGGNPSRLFLSGHSAGAHIAMMVTLNGHYLQAVGENTHIIKGMLGLAGPYDFLPMSDLKIIELFSTANKDTDTQPITFVRHGAPPVLLLVGAKDDEVSPLNSDHLAKSLKKHGNTVQEITYQDVGHIGIILSLAYGFRGKSPALEDMDKFMRSIP